jgi:hypothetical protein
LTPTQEVITFQFEIAIHILYGALLINNFGMRSGLCLDMSDRAAFLYTAFDSMFSSKFCGSRAADFCGSVSNGICMLISAKDVTETLTGYDQIFRRVLKKLQAGATPIQKIAFLVNFEAGSENSADEISKEISDRLSQIWGDFSSDGQVIVSCF